MQSNLPSLVQDAGYLGGFILGIYITSMIVKHFVAVFKGEGTKEDKLLKCLSNLNKKMTDFDKDVAIQSTNFKNCVEKLTDAVDRNTQILERDIEHRNELLVHIKMQTEHIRSKQFQSSKKN